MRSCSLAAPPVVLPDIPSFFRPTINERRLDSTDGAIRRSLVGAARSDMPGKSVARIQGNTRINAGANNLSATASGSGNQAGNRVGTIGGD